MWSTIWHLFFFDPIYNILVYFIDVVPGGDVGLSIILTTIVVKVFLLPLSLKAARTQKIMKELDPKLKEIKERLKDKREEQAREMMEVYRDAGLNPFASVILLFVQIPIIIALYFSVARGGGVPLPEINTAVLYAFVPTPETVNMIFLGFMDITQKSLPLALLAGITQFIHAQLSIPKPEPRKKDEVLDMKADFARSMQLQMRYMMPLIIFMVAYTISAAIAIYFTISNLMALVQEYLVRRHR
ncbi:membrane protein insertase YidC [Candidatus Kaiserbacteria bacterium]|nr:membrane protein insertase YidC [Candidatus Kaiserbacteria bacterium]MCB9811512.1 membrane protein insertase YidC [Candidatus Nomurabacteria bacterium]